MRDQLRCVELFAGAGGLALGAASAGFRHTAVVERDPNACETFRVNSRRTSAGKSHWPVVEMDARNFVYSSLPEQVHLLSGGPPCQPFSFAGNHLGQRDQRDMFPEAVRAVRELQPLSFIFENVRGLLRPAFEDYFSHVLLQLQHPSIIQRKGERSRSHFRRLVQHHTALAAAPEYNVVFTSLNAADFGVPQNRHRVFIVGFRSDVGARWAIPSPTHSRAALLQSQWLSGDYWERHEVSKRKRPPVPPKSVLERLRTLADRDAPATIAWQTVRDAIGDLPTPCSVAPQQFPNHVLTIGARKYHGHTGSALDLPAKALKAGMHGVPGGENMLVDCDGSVRYFTIREAARIQTFPDKYTFSGSWTRVMHQLGNAVPVSLASAVALSVAKSIRTSLRAAANKV